MTRVVSYAAPSSKYRSKQYVKRPWSGPAKNMKTLIKRAISQMAEKKMVIASGANISLFTVAATSPNALGLTPLVSQGTSQNQRVGNQIRVVKGQIRGHLILRPYDSVLNPTIAPLSVKFWLCRYKKSTTATFSSTDAASAFFDTGAGVSGMTGNVVDMDLYPNTDSWDILQTKQYRMGLSSATNNATSINTLFFDNSPSQIAFQFEFGSHLGSCMYNDTNNEPTNKSLFLVIQPVYANGSATNGLAPVELDYATQITYIDV